jgi:hypothetical protein
MVLFVSIISVSSCKSKKNVDAKNDIIVDTIQLYNVSFYSIGSGIDYKSLKKFEDLIKSKQNLDSNIFYNKYPWGREGEVDYCIEVSKLSLEAKKHLEDNIRMVLNSSENARININKPCRKGR